MDLKIYFDYCKRLFNRCVFCTQPMAAFKPDEAASLLAERFNTIGWIYKQESIMFNRLASRLAALSTRTRKMILAVLCAGHIASTKKNHGEEDLSIFKQLS